MNREIKFRGWNPKTEKMLTDFNNCIVGFELDGTFSVAEYREFGSHEEWDSVILLQFTGLKDKNGYEIYEDDILFDGEHRYRVYSIYGGFGIKASYWAKNASNLGIGDDLIIQPLADNQTMSYISQSCDLIGNIYENPELLK